MQKKLLSSVCSQEVTACFMLASTANCLPGRCFLRCLKTKTSLGIKIGTVLHHNQSQVWVAGCSSVMSSSWIPSTARVCLAPWQQIQHEATCHLLATNTCLQLPLHQDTSLGDTKGQMLKCQWWLHGGLVCTICYTCAMYTEKSELSPQHQCLLPYFLKLPCMYYLPTANAF